MHKADLMRSFDEWVDRSRHPAGGPAPVRGRPRAHRRRVPGSLCGVGEFGQQRRARDIRPGRAVDGGQRRAGDVAPAGAAAVAADARPVGARRPHAFVGATGGHFASTVSIERLRRLNPTLRKPPAQRLVPAAGRERSSRRSTHSARRSSRPIRARRCCWPKSAWTGRLRSSPLEVWTGGEDLSEAKREFVQQAFGCPVVNSYGASEFLSLASECERGHLHLNSDWAILEAVDAQGRAVPPGEVGATTLLTNLANHVQPLIRYDLGDRVSAARPPLRVRLPPARDRSAGSQRRHPASGSCGRGRDQRAAAGVEHDARRGGRAVRLPDRADRGRASWCCAAGLRGSDADAALRRGRTALAGFLARQGADPVRIRCRQRPAASARPNRQGRSGWVNPWPDRAWAIERPLRRLGKGTKAAGPVRLDEGQGGHAARAENAFDLPSLRLVMDLPTQAHLKTLPSGPAGGNALPGVPGGSRRTFRRRS